MTITNKTTSGFRNNLETRLHAYSNQTGENIARLRRKVAFDRLLARIFTKDPSFFFLKGGYAMELQFSRARATKDIDLTCLKRSQNNQNEPISELILQELQNLARINLNDFFTFQIGQPQIDIENAPYGGTRHNVSSFVENRSFADFNLDVGCDFLIGRTELIRGNNWLEFNNIPPPTISTISKEQQFAEKLHSYTLPRVHANTRSKDLVDLFLLLPSIKDCASFQSTLQRVFKARNTHPLPKTLPAPPNFWELPFEKMAAECGISSNLNECFKQIFEFYSSLNF